ncbi:ATP-grasp fold amidoligase family protein [Alkalicoccus halolimnae]|uniref:ATP-grasp fold amidoligase family protein n=1 Tax=Alkalicoccus halolimnae TaxID=1667239 RepID=A0A5C7FGW8_9BACI|nr:ATP-grasp fold amidoligase family protein [Alkalicoccus halolimnae]TXF85524.1 teichuronopeptide biosynthesis [Alkalicoccus halolimnae]
MQPSPFSRVRARLLGSKMTRLEQENKQLRRRIYEQEAASPPPIPEASPEELEHLRETVRTARREGTLFELAADIAAKKQQTGYYCREAMLEALKQASAEGETAEDRMRRLLMPAFTTSELPERFVRGIEHRAVPSLESLASFRGQLTSRVRRRQKGHQLPEWELDDKQVSRQFASEIGLRVPEVIEKNAPLAALPLEAGTVVKPAAGAGGRGVYILRSETDILNAKTSEVLTSTAELKEIMQKDLQHGRVAEDRWNVEKLYYADEDTGEPARDIKCYTFYGKTALILEITRSPETAYCWWTPDGERVDTGKYTGSLMEGKGILREELDAAARLGAALPAPFCRFDLLRTTEGLVFGECTPKPGNYDQFNETIDIALGEAFLDAEERLFQDLVNGASYPYWRNLL